VGLSGRRQSADIADTLHLRNVAMATIFGFLYMGCTWRHLKNTTEQSMCGGDAALCQITLTTCYYYDAIRGFEQVHQQASHNKLK